MYKIEDEDLKLSEKFKKAQLNLEIKKQEIVAVNKKQNNDTIEACLLFQSNVTYFKEKVKDHRLVNRASYLVNQLTTDFPKANEKVLLKLIKKNGIYTYNQIISIVFLVLLIPFFSSQFYLLSHFGFNSSTFFNYCMPSSLLFSLLVLIIDSHIVNKRG